MHCALLHAASFYCTRRPHRSKAAALAQPTHHTPMQWPRAATAAAAGAVLPANWTINALGTHQFDQRLQDMTMQGSHLHHQVRPST